MNSQHAAPQQPLARQGEKESLTLNPSPAGGRGTSSAFSPLAQLLGEGPGVRDSIHPGEHSCDVLIVGGGPAGIAAASTAAQAGKRVIILDDNPALGGQIWRGAQQTPQSTRWLRQAAHPNITTILGARVFYENATQQVVAESADGLYVLNWKDLIIATGARERFIPFPGWTLPGVTGVGGLQALVKGGLPIAGRRLVIAGSGPLLLAVAAYLRRHGARILTVAEQAPPSRLIAFGAGLIEQPAKLMQAIQLRSQLGNTPYRAGCWVTAVEKQGESLRVTLRQGGRTWSLDCDSLACAYHLVPNPELALLLGCRVEDGYVIVDEHQQTTRDHVYCAGEGTGIGGVELALIEGQIAAYAAAGQLELAQALLGARSRLRRFARRLNSTFAPRAELKALPAPDTIVCRCEDVTFGQIAQYRSWREAKLHTRCGMGACQGRICGEALKFALNWEVDSIRPPVFPVRLESLAGVVEERTTGTPR